MSKVRFKVGWIGESKKGVEDSIGAGTIAEIEFVTNEHVCIATCGVSFMISYDAMRAATEPYSEVTRSNPVKVPGNFTEQFELLWAAKGRKGSKAKAKEKYKTFFKGSTEQEAIDLTNHLIKDIESRQDELGMPERHLTSYLNGRMWEK